jgi:hypothetical protein
MAQSKVVSLPQFISSSLVVFGKYINWPLNHKNENFVITVVGDVAVYKELTRLSQDMKMGAQNISVRHVSKVSEITGFSHIIYLSDASSGSFSKVIEKIGADNTLLVTSRDGLLSSGSGINFIEVDGLMRFEISKSNINKRNLEVHSWLEKMSTRQG